MEVKYPLTFGTKASGRIADWEYGGFLAKTAEKSYFDEDEGNLREPAAYLVLQELRNRLWGIHQSEFCL
jgi:hypothetical protein